MNTVLFWRDAEGDQELFAPHRAQIQRLLNGEYENLSLERLDYDGEFPLYSIHGGSDIDGGSKARRILFTTLNKKIFLLDVIENHDYEKSRFLRNHKVLPAYMQKVVEEIKRDKNKFKLCERLEEIEEQGVKQNVTLRGVEFHHQQVIEFTDAQETITTMTLPAIALGPAGSGKTSVAVSMILKAIRHASDNEKPVLFVTRQPGLLKRTRKEFMESASAQKARKHVEFLTIEELAKRSNPSAQVTKGYEDFVVWVKEKKIKTEFDLHKMWLEFRIASGYSKEEYEKLGNKQSCTFLPEGQRADARKHIYELYTQYLAFLKDSNQLDVELNFPQGNKDFSLVLADESQDNSCGQLNQLISYAEDNRIVYFLGDHQILFDGKSRKDHLGALCHRLGLSLKEQRLEGTFRCSEAVADASNCIIALKLHLVGGAGYKGEVSRLELANTAKKKAGEVEWRSTDADVSDLYRQGIQLAVVVTDPALIPEAKLKFGTRLVFTPNQIKGLEYERIVLWKPLNSSRAVEANKRLRVHAFTGEHSGHRAKGETHEEFLAFCDELNTAVTRSRNQLVIIQDSPHEIEHLVNAIKPAFTQNTSTSSTKQQWTIENSEDDWKNEAQRIRDFSEDPEKTEEMVAELTKPELSIRFFPPRAAESDARKTPKKVKPKAASSASTSTTSSTSSASTSSTKVKALALTDEQMIGILDNFLEKNGKIEGLIHVVNTPQNSKVFLRCVANHGRFLNLPLQEMGKVHDLNDTLKTGLRQLHLQFLSRGVQTALQMYVPIGNTPLMIASSLGLDGAISLFHKLGANLDAKNINGLTAAHLAAASCKESILKLLIDLGAQVDKKCKKGSTLWHAAVSWKSNQVEKCFAHLKKAGLDPNQETYKGLTPAAEAVIAGDVIALTGLKKYGAELDRLDKSGYSLVHYAIFTKQYHLLPVFKKLGVNLNQACSEKVRSMDTAVRLEILSLRVTNQALTPIEAAVQLGAEEAVAKLIELGVDPKQKGKNGMSLLHTAAGFGWPEIIKFIYRQGVSLSELDSIGATPAHIAAETGTVESLVVLKELGAPLNNTNPYGVTPFAMAIWHNQKAIVDFYIKENPSYLETPLVFDVSLIRSIPDKAINKGQLQALEDKLKDKAADKELVIKLPEELAEMLEFHSLAQMLRAAKQIGAISREVEAYQDSEEGLIGGMSSQS